MNLDISKIKSELREAIVRLPAVGNDIPVAFRTKVYGKGIKKDGSHREVVTVTGFKIGESDFQKIVLDVLGKELSKKVRMGVGIDVYNFETNRLKFSVVFTEEEFKGLISSMFDMDIELLYEEYELFKELYFRTLYAGYKYVEEGHCEKMTHSKGVFIPVVGMKKEVVKIEADSEIIQLLKLKKKIKEFDECFNKLNENIRSEFMELYAERSDIIEVIDKLIEDRI